MELKCKFCNWDVDTVFTIIHRFKQTKTKLDELQSDGGICCAKCALKHFKIDLKTCLKS